MHRREFLAAALAAAAAPGRIIDTHTHFYDPARPQGAPWPPKSDALLYRRVLPAEFRKMTQPLGVTGTVVVEASAWLEDNQWVLDLARDNPVIVGFVGHLEPGAPEFRANLERFRKNPLFRGIRVSLNQIARGFGQPGFVADIKRLAGADLELDAIGDAAMFTHLVRLADQAPDLRIVIDHLPYDRPADDALRELGRRPLVYAKVSGELGRLTDRAAMDEVWGIFGAERVIYGSNWPVSERGGAYRAVLKAVEEYFGGKGQEAAQKYFWKNSLAAYRWIAR